MAEAILVTLGLAADELTGAETSEGRRESASARLDCDPNRLVLARFRLLPDDDEDDLPTRPPEPGLVTEPSPAVLAGHPQLSVSSSGRLGGAR